ncbi:MAG: hypothetical protein MJ252_16500 [archaeon]|nr:hypothetical protein [archaeon]
MKKILKAFHHKKKENARIELTQYNANQPKERGSFSSFKHNLKLPFTHNKSSKEDVKKNKNYFTFRVLLKLENIP